MPKQADLETVLEAAREQSKRRCSYHTPQDYPRPRQKQLSFVLVVVTGTKTSVWTCQSGHF